ncbi:glycoside hydrolase family 32 protein [Paludisphaera soli]|uniref:glycoside hydrolase family 32 protein n=1 Tax=Paludisphaera soli TaxID=2712865 RepID=UPI0013ED1AA4|nr:GH32 C-terminal domain-containing protein [Paludisphaera soli]
MPVVRSSWIMIFGVALLPTGDPPAAAQEVTSSYSERYRPQYHFSPRSGWIGDPCGLVHHKGVYHLFWWGHATSKDLVHWDERPYPLADGAPGLLKTTGSAVIDEADTAGFGRPGEPAMVAVYTLDHGPARLQTQCLSSSTDFETFKFYEGNPVLDIQSPAFRDPDVFWHEPTRRWVMVIALPEERKVRFYASPDLKSWTPLSDFGPLGAREQIWEVPNLIRLPLDGDRSRMKWVLVCGMGPNKEQFFVGEFDGTRFTPDEAQRAFLKDGAGVPGEVFADFEADGYAGWTAEGDAFGAGPDVGAPPLAGYLGRRLVSTRRAGPEATGSLTSPEFTLAHGCINFLIGGGDHPGETGLQLLVDGEVVREATGRDSDALTWSGWDVSALKGNRARLRVVDRHRGDWGNVTLDHVVYSDVLLDHGREQASWIDWGPDYYALRAWRDFGEREDRTVWLGWMGNWEYAQKVPTSWGRGAEALPREVELATAPGGYAIRQRPIPELASLRREAFEIRDRPLRGGGEDLGFRPSRNCYEIEASFAWDGPGAAVGFDLCIGGDARTTVGFDARTSTVYLDRRRSGEAGFDPRFARRVSAPHAPSGREIRLRIFLDQSSVEVFVDDGGTTLTALIFPDPANRGVEAFSRGAPAMLKHFRAWELESIWKTPGPALR